MRPHRAHPTPYETRDALPCLIGADQADRELRGRAGALTGLHIAVIQRPRQGRIAPARRPATSAYTFAQYQ